MPKMKFYLLFHKIKNMKLMISIFLFFWKKPIELTQKEEIIKLFRAETDNSSCVIY